MTTWADKKGLERMFHAKTGWFFERAETGGVTAQVHEVGADLAGPVTFDANTWASIVATVSAAGEDAETFQRALEFHG